MGLAGAAHAAAVVAACAALGLVAAGRTVDTSQVVPSSLNPGLFVRSSRLLRCRSHIDVLERHTCPGSTSRSESSVQFPDEFLEVRFSQTSFDHHLIKTLVFWFQFE